MNEEQEKQLLKHVRIMKNCIVTITVCAVVLIAYDGFQFYRYHFGYSLSDIAFQKKIQFAYRNQDHQRRVELCENRLKEQPEDNQALWGLGDAYYKLGRWQDSIDTYNRLLDLNPGMEEHIKPIIEKAQEKLKEQEPPQQINSLDSSKAAPSPSE